LSRSYVCVTQARQFARIVLRNVWISFAVRVQCGETTMTITLITTEPFKGRMYVSGYAETCGVHGHGRNITTLKLPLPRKKYLGRSNIACGLTPAFSIDNENRYLVLSSS
jgi:hypothetical protein